MIEHRKQSKADCFLCYWQIRSRYSDGVLPVIFLKVVQKLLSLVKSCSEADLLNGGVGGFQQEFCVVHTGGDDISVRGKTGFLLKQPAEIKGA